MLDSKAFTGHSNDVYNRHASNDRLTWHNSWTRYRNHKNLMYSGVGVVYSKSIQYTTTQHHRPDGVYGSFLPLKIPSLNVLDGRRKLGQTTTVHSACSTLLQVLRSSVLSVL